RPPIDPLSEREEYVTDGVKTYRDDFMAQMEIGNTWKLEEVASTSFDAIYVAGGHGALWDLADDRQLAKILYEAASNDTPVAMVGHGVAALYSLEKLRPGMLNGLRVTAFTDTEEALLKRHRQVPFQLADRLKSSGAHFGHAIIPFTPHVEADGPFITGQHAASSAMAAQTMAGRMDLATLGCP